MVPELQRELLRYGAAGYALLLVTAGVLNTLENERFALQFLMFSAGCWSYVCWHCWKLLALNSADLQSALFPTLGHANRLTLLRAFLIACTAGFLFNDYAWYWVGFIPALLYTIAAILDRVDGYLARRQQQTTMLGRELDTIIDALGLVVAPLLAVLYGKTHVSYLLVSVAWYMFAWGLYWRRSHYKSTYPLLPSKLRRTMAGFQMGYVAGALWPPLDPVMTQAFGFAFMLPLLTGFWVDWLVVSGRLNTRTPGTMDRLLLLDSFTQRHVMPVLRLVLIALLIHLIILSQSFTAAPPVATGALILAMLGILFGILGRACATTVMLLLCWFFPFAVFNLLACAAVAGIVLIILLGTGSFSWRKADEAWINRQDGA